MIHTPMIRPANRILAYTLNSSNGIKPLIALWLIFLAALLMVSTNAFADNQFYLELKSGRATSKESGSRFLSDPKSGKILELEAGYFFNDSISLALNASLTPSLKYSSSHYSKAVPIMWNDEFSSHRISSLMINSYYNFVDRKKFIVPYVGVGAGMVKYTIKDTVIYRSFPIYNSDTDLLHTKKGTTSTNLSWNVMFGGLIRLTDSLKLDMQCKYTDLGRATTADYVTDTHGVITKGEASTSKFKMQSITAGLRYEF